MKKYQNLTTKLLILKKEYDLRDFENIINEYKIVENPERHENCCIFVKIVYNDGSILEYFTVKRNYSKCTYDVIMKLDSNKENERTEHSTIILSSGVSLNECLRCIIKEISEESDIFKIKYEKHIKNKILENSQDRIQTNLKEDGTLEIYLGNSILCKIENGENSEDFV